MYEAKNFATRAHAFEGKLFVINAAGVISKDMKEMLCPDAEKQSMFGSMGGGSSIIGSEGEYITGPLGDEEEILYGEVDISRRTADKMMHDTCGHYQRHDVFNLTLNETEPQLFSCATSSTSEELRRPVPADD